MVLVATQAKGCRVTGTIAGLEAPSGVQCATVRCPYCRTRPGCSDIARFMYGIRDAPCERCNGLGLVKIPIPDHHQKDPP